MDCEEIAEGFLLKARTPGVNDVWAREVFVRKCSYLLTFVVDFWQFRSRSIITLTMLVSVFLNLISFRLLRRIVDIKRNWGIGGISGISGDALVVQPTMHKNCFYELSK